MASHKEYLGQLSEIDEISFWAMMGEYIIYRRNLWRQVSCKNNRLIRKAFKRRTERVAL